MNRGLGCRAPLSPLGARAAWLWAWLWALAFTQLGTLADCPKVCECKWRDGKEVVTCRDAHFIDIPRGLDPSTQVLDLRHNNLKILPRDSFVYTGLVNLQKVWLNFCNLIKLEEGAFRMLNNVVELDLSNNFLRGVPSEALTDLPGLRVLRLAHNGLTVLPASAFLPVPDLVQLDLNHNTITTIERGALRSLAKLGVLELSSNRLAFLDVGELKPLVALRVAHLDGNPWRCDCHLRPLSKWMQARNLAASVSPVCSFPRWLTGNNWQLLDEEEFVCAPVVTAVAPRVLAAEGENVSLACRVESEVETTITWLAGDAPLLNTSEAQRYTVVEVLGQPQHAVYLSNLTISDVAPYDQGTYRCMAENRAGRGQVNLTLQVSHEVAEVRVATVDDSYYMKGGVVGGISILAVVLLASCLLIYCKVRSTRRPRQEDDKLVTPQTSRGSDGGEHHTLTGYQVVPTNDMEEQPSSCRQQPPWMLREASASGQSLEVSGAESRRQEAVEVPVTHPVAATSTVSYVEIPKSGVGAVRTTLEDPTRWKDPLVYHSRDVLLHRLCGRSVSQAAVAGSNGGHYPDLLDLPQQQQQFQQQQQEMQQHTTYLPLHTLNPSYCTLPRTRARGHGDAPTRAEEEETAAAASTTAATGGEASHPHPHAHPHHYHHHQHLLQYQLPPPLPPNLNEAASYRSSSALNLALSEAACHAYAHIPPHALAPCPPPAAHARQDLILAHRSHCAGTSAEGGGGSCAPDPYRFEYHAAQLEKFLREYRCLQEQLIHMKQSYEAQQHRGSAPRLDYCSETQGTVAPPNSNVAPLCTTTSASFHASPQLGTTSSTLVTSPASTSSSIHVSQPTSTCSSSSVHASAPKPTNVTVLPHVASSSSSPPVSVSLPAALPPPSSSSAPLPNITSPLYIITDTPPSLDDLPPPLDVIPPPPPELLPPPPCEVLPPPVIPSIPRSTKSTPTPQRPNSNSSSPVTTTSSSSSSSSSCRGTSKSSKPHGSVHHTFSDPTPPPSVPGGPARHTPSAEPLKSILKKPSESAKHHHHHHQQQQQQQPKHKNNTSASSSTSAASSAAVTSSRQ